MNRNETAPSLSKRPPARRQAGIALVMALILLVVVAIVGLASMRNTTLQQVMTANFYDRQVAFQAAEAGLRAGAAAITASPGQIYNCGQGGSLCEANPFYDLNAADFIQTVASGNGTGEFDPSSVGPQGGSGLLEPQYVVENMGTWVTGGSGTVQTGSHYGYQNANKGSTTTAIYYRVTACSADPTQVGDRALVTLQAMYKQ